MIKALQHQEGWEPDIKEHRAVKLAEILFHGTEFSKSFYVIAVFVSVLIILD